MALNVGESTVLTAVSERLKAIASGVSGARQRSLLDQAALLDRLLAGESAQDVKTDVDAPPA